MFHVKKTFDFTALTPRNTYHYDFQMAKINFFPDLGHQALIFLGKLNYSTEFPKLLELSKKVENQTDIIFSVQSWIQPFESFMITYYERNVTHQTLSDQEWNFYLSKFLFSINGIQYRWFFKFETPIECGQPTSIVKVRTESLFLFIICSIFY
jgi:hypothetical protein